jgi:tRNA(Ile)-lysidine synthase
MLCRKKVLNYNSQIGESRNGEYMLSKVKDTILKHNMIEKGDNVIIGISGGADSSCLLHILFSVKEEYNINLYGIHIHHGIRGKEADEDAEFSKQLCEKLNIKFKIVYANILEQSKKLGVSEEEAGRIVRYNEFSKMAIELSGKIATAHHMNDSVETVMYNLIRGSGLIGLCGIPPTRDNIIRPLINCTRKEIEDYCNNFSIVYKEDYTNKLDKYTRNKIRLNLIPYIEENFNPSFVRQISNTSNILREEEQYMNEETIKAFEFCLDKKCNDRICFELYKTKSLNSIIRKRMIRRAIGQKVGLKDIESKHIELVENLLWKGTGKRVDLPRNIHALINYDRLEIIFNKEEQNTLWEYNITQLKIDDPISVKINECNIVMYFKLLQNKKNSNFPKNVCTKWFDYDKIKYNLIIRNRLQGDYIKLKGISGRKKIKDYFIDAKIPRENRSCVPLLADGNNIMWIIGHRISEQYKVTEHTNTILEVKFEEAQNAR